MMGEWAMGGWGMGLGFLFMLLLWALVILGIVALVRWLQTPTEGPRHNKTALEILRERYARGEIDREEFEQKKRDLES